MLRQVKEMSYRMKIRKVLKQASIEELKITKEETVKELERRSKNGH